ncbi:BTAD domain-containing putative transcriptional regulator [Amycolatopsis sp. lyj-84]|uniref:AfsR/SARP family transcriptional regulator n=1 Tax=Amycolatopsis sp. lyj-84 TaxID=2789284 RepID=UPI003978F456
MSSIEFRVLGRLEVHTEGGTIALGSAKQRNLLAVLLLHPGRTVPIRRLIRTLWGDEPPLSAVANLRTYANRLRGVLPGDRISGRASGYEILLRQGELDLHVFAERAGAGRAALARGDHAAAVRHLGEALSACRGAVLEDLSDNEALAGSIAPVEELRLSVSEDHLEARLRLGEHREVIAPLREFVAEHPLRERPWAHLMTALYRSGDPAGALAVYTDCRRVLADRLGLEPSPDLAKLHRAMLDRDPGLTTVSPAPVATVGDPAPKAFVPQELPVRCRAFGGRAGDAARLASLLVGPERSGPKVAVVHGPCGIGKSALVLEVAHRVGARFPGGQLYVDLGVDGPASRVPPRLLRHLGVPTSDIPWTPDEAAAVLRSRLSHRAALLVLDGATESAALRALIPATGSCAVLITSRSPLMLDGAEHVVLGRLSEKDGLDILARVAGRSRVDADPRAAAEIVRHCHGIPAALRIAGTILANRPTRPLSWLGNRLAPEESRLDELGFGGESLRALYLSAFQPIAAGKDPLAASAFRLLGRPGYEVCRTGQAADALGVCPLKAEAALDRLVDLGLAEWGDEDTYRLPPLMRLFSADLATAVPAQQSALAW